MMENYSYHIEAKDQGTGARAGRLKTPHGEIETPIFMPVGTAATVKGIHFEELESSIEAEIILANTYHLELRPGHQLISEFGGLHQFTSWNKPMLTDSGGYQVYSLSNMRKVDEQGVRFRSHIDGSQRFLSPETATRIQQHLGADIIMAFDECTPYPCDYDFAKKSMRLTHRWLDRCMDYFRENEGIHGYEQHMTPIVQGSVYADLREESATYVANKNAQINAIGGLSVGEPIDELLKHVEGVTNVLPGDKPRYLMGVGTPSDILQCIALGIDMFDCVLPTRNARHGLLYTSHGIINIKNAKWAKSAEPIDPNIGLKTSEKHSLAYLRHLFVCKEALGAQLASLQNLRFYLWMVKQARREILTGTFDTWLSTFLPIISKRL